MILHFLGKKHAKETESEQISRFHACAHIYPLMLSQKPACFKKRQVSMFSKKDVCHPPDGDFQSLSWGHTNASSLDIFDFKISAMLIEEKI